MKRTMSSNNYKSLSQNLFGENQNNNSDNNSDNNSNNSSENESNTETETLSLPLPQFKTQNKTTQPTKLTKPTKLSKPTKLTKSTQNNLIEIKPHYVLNIYVDDKELKEKYKDQELKNNKIINQYLDGESNVYFDAGIDLYNSKAKTIKGQTLGKVNHEIICSMHRVNKDGSESPVCYYLYPRSSTGSKTKLRMANSVGIIDSGYRGNIIAMLDNIDTEDYNIISGDRLVQICAPNIEYPLKLKLAPNLESLGLTERGAGGFGSTGR